MDEMIGKAVAASLLGETGNSDGDPLATRAIVLVHQTRDLLGSLGPPNGSGHSGRMMGCVASLLGLHADGALQLNRAEGFLLFEAIILHDIGKSPTVRCQSEGSDHAAAGARWIRDHSMELGIKYEHEVEIVALLVECHERGQEERIRDTLPDYVPVPELDESARVRQRLLAALLCVADDMDEICLRVPPARGQADVSLRPLMAGAECRCRAIVFSGFIRHMEDQQRAQNLVDGLAARISLLQPVFRRYKSGVTKVKVDDASGRYDIEASVPDLPELAYPNGAGDGSAKADVEPGRRYRSLPPEAPLPLADGHYWYPWAYAGDRHGIRLTTRWEKESPMLPAPLAAYADTYRDAIRHRALDKAPDKRTTNQSRYCLLCVENRTDESEIPRLELTVGPSDYARYLATNGWDAEMARKAGLGDECQRAVRAFLNGRSPDYVMRNGFFNSVGMNIVTIISENGSVYVPIRQRSGTAVGDGFMSIAVIEGARRASCDDTDGYLSDLCDEVSETDPALDVEKLAKRAMEREAKWPLKPHEQVRLTAFGYDTFRWQPNILAYTLLCCSRADFEALGRVHAPDRFEFDPVYEWLPFTPSAIAETIVRQRAAAGCRYAPPAFLPWVEVALLYALFGYYADNSEYLPVEINYAFREAGIFAQARMA